VGGVVPAAARWGRARAPPPPAPPPPSSAAPPSPPWVQLAASAREWEEGEIERLASEGIGEGAKAETVGEAFIYWNFCGPLMGSKSCSI
jgi:hypothetical protein